MEIINSKFLLRVPHHPADQRGRERTLVLNARHTIGCQILKIYKLNQ